jgi:signal peptide peptidase SppA
MLRFPIILLWNIISNLIRLPYVLIRAIFKLWSRPKSQYVRFVIHRELPRWSHYTWLSWWQEQPQDLTIEEWAKTLRRLAQNKHVEGIVIEIKDLQAGWPVLNEFHSLLCEYRGQGKRIVLFPQQLSIVEFFLSTAANDLLISPSAQVVLQAPAFHSFFFGSFLERLGISFDVHRIGIHKNAPESMTRAFPSPVHRSDLLELYNTLCEHIFSKMAEIREETPEQLFQLFAWGVFSMEEALELKLINAVRFSERVTSYLLEKEPIQLIYPEYPMTPEQCIALNEMLSAENGSEPTTDDSTEAEAKTEDSTEAEAKTEDSTEAEAKTEDSTKAEAKTEDSTKAEAKTEDSTKAEAKTGGSTEAEQVDGVEESISKGDLNNFVVDFEEFDLDGLVYLRWKPLRRSREIVVIPVSGTIIDDHKHTERPGENASKSWIVEQIHRSARNPRIAALVIWVNSPGGSGYASEEIWWALRQAQEVKPVVAYLDGYAASGGYYVACGAHKIISSPFCITGSIGVFGGKVNAEQLLHRLGIGYASVGETLSVRLQSPLRKASVIEQERWIQQLSLFYERFVMRVADNRHADPNEIEEKARGKVYLGSTAHSLGLVDHCADMEYAIQCAVEMAKLKKPSVRWCKPPLRLSLHRLSNNWHLRWFLAAYQLWQRCTGSFEGDPLMVLNSATSANSKHIDQLLNLINQMGCSAALDTQSVGQLSVHASVGQQIMADYLPVIELLMRGEIAAWCDMYNYKM